MNATVADVRADVEPLRCILDIDLDGTVSVTLLDECSAQDAQYAAGVVARSDPDLTQLTVRHFRTCCSGELHRSRTAQLVLARQVNIYEAKSQFSRLVTEIQDTGAGVIIARNGRPVAQLLPLDVNTAERCNR
jgi:Antitoxin Phd_YefM, type II toxin-antitoxin system